MNKNTIIVILIVLALVVLVTIIQSSLSGRNNDLEIVTPQENQIEELATITALHQYSEGQHILAGEIDLPTPCHILNSEVIVDPSMPEKAVLNLSYSSLDDTLCAQVITPAKYKVEFMAGEQVEINATLNDQPVLLNLIPVPAEENLEDFEIYIKG